jgi:hypothetical protein
MVVCYFWNGGKMLHFYLGCWDKRGWLVMWPAGCPNYIRVTTANYKGCKTRDIKGTIVKLYSSGVTLAILYFTSSDSRLFSLVRSQILVLAIEWGPFYHVPRNILAYCRPLRQPVKEVLHMSNNFEFCHATRHFGGVVNAMPCYAWKCRPRHFPREREFESHRCRFFPTIFATTNHSSKKSVNVVPPRKLIFASRGILLHI